MKVSAERNRFLCGNCTTHLKTIATRWRKSFSRSAKLSNRTWFVTWACRISISSRSKKRGPLSLFIPFRMSTVSSNVNAKPMVSWITVKTISWPFSLIHRSVVDESINKSPSRSFWSILARSISVRPIALRWLGCWASLRALFRFLVPAAFHPSKIRSERSTSNSIRQTSNWSTRANSFSLSDWGGVDTL